MRQLTDPKGRFALAGLPAGSISLRAQKLGFLDVGSQAGPALPTRRITLNGGEWISDVVMPLWRPGALGGTVRNEHGEHVVDVWVRVLMKIRVLGHDRFVARGLTRTDDRGRYRVGALAPGQYVVQVPNRQPPPSRSVQQTEADSAPWMPAAHAPVPPPPSHGRSFTYPATFSPNARSLALAAVVDLPAGEAREDLDITLEPVPAFQVSGTVIGPLDALNALMLRLTAEGTEGLGQEAVVATAIVGNDGRFDLPNVPAGFYTLEASHAVTDLRIRAAAADLHELEFSMPLHHPSGKVIMEDVELGPAGLRAEITTFGGGSPGYWTRQPIAVGKDEANLVVSMRHTGTMRGRIRKALAPGAPVPGMEPSVGIELDPADGAPRLGVLRTTSRSGDASDRFTIPGILPGKYFLRLKHGWIAKSISWNGRDYTDSPFDGAEASNFNDVEVVVTNAGATLSGRVLDSAGAPIDEAVVTLFPASAALWRDFGLWPTRIRTVMSGSKGRYEIAGVPAGDYNVIAEANRSSATLLDPDLFELAQWRARRVSLAWARLTNLDIVVASAVR